MYLKSLALRGFKSFADKTVLKFEPGVTSIVGPNGSGKSNVTDAVLWVLGEQSARSLRGASMEDVIFAGSSTRQALGIAEVSLVLDNSDGELPIEFSEVTITRRIYRTSESEYYINNSSCRLLDIQELLSGSGLGRGLYSIIGQGKIEEALSARPEERRVFIEEAAGVLKHKRRRDRAVRRLASMDANLVRIRDILGEVKRQLAPLKRQAELAQSYVELSVQLKEKELSLAVIDLKGLQEKWVEAENEEAGVAKKVELLESELAKVESEREAMEVALEAEEGKAVDLSDRRRRIQSVIDRLHAAASLAAEKGRSASERLESLTTDSYRCSTRRLAVEKQIQQYQRERQELDKAIDKSEKRFEDARSNQALVSADVARLIEESKRLDLEIAETERAVSNYETASANLELAIKTGEVQLEILKEQSKTVEKRQAEVEAGAGRAAEIVAGMVSEIEALENTFKEREAERSNRRSELDDSRAQLARVEREIEAARARVKALEDTLESDPQGAAARSAGGEGVLAIVGDAIKVDKVYEKAIEAILALDVYCLVLSDVQSAKGLLSSESEGLSLMPLERARIAKGEGAIVGLIEAASVVDCDERIRPAIEALLAGFYVADTFEQAMMVYGERAVATLDGKLLLPSGKIVSRPRRDSTGRLTRKREIEELGSGASALEAKIASLKAGIDGCSLVLAMLEEEVRTCALELEKRKAELAAARDKVEEIERGRLKADEEERALSERIKTCAARIESRGAELVENKELLVEKSEALTNGKMGLEESRRGLQELVKREAEASIETSKAQVEYDALLGRRRGLERTIEETEKELEGLLEGAARDEADARRLSLVRERSNPVISAIEVLAFEATEEGERLKGRTAKGEVELSRLREALQERREEAVAARRSLDEIKEALHAIEIEKARLQMEVSAAVSRIVDELDVPLEKALAKEIAEDSWALEDGVSRLRRRMASIGPVNPMAIEEYRELEERAALFTGQIEDISASKRALDKIVRAIDRRIKERYAEAFDRVNHQFKQVFGYLFPGGTAELIMTEPDAPDISGVDIIAQPSGKRLQRMSLLSGGEKSLVSLAFLFSLYLDKPCPFYILDEAEAALDDVNLNRLIKLLDELKKGTQFLIITHQRRTMEMSDALYGVSMQADGVSKLISQKFSEVAEVV